MESYQVKLDAFEGPMDLLLHLITKNKIDIYDIPMAELTKQYLDYLHAMREFNMEIASSFLVMAATLLQIKSRMMLPKVKKEDEDEEEDPRLELVERLLEYRKFKEISSTLGKMADVQDKFVSRKPLDLPVHHLPPGNLSPQLLLEAFQSVLAVKVKAEPQAVRVARETYHVRDKMRAILQRLQKAKGRLRFADAFATGSKPELITTFLALLELMRLRSVRVTQSQAFADIFITAGKETKDADRRTEK